MVNVSKSQHHLYQHAAKLMASSGLLWIEETCYIWLRRADGAAYGFSSGYVRSHRFHMIDEDVIKWTCSMGMIAGRLVDRPPAIVDWRSNVCGYAMGRVRRWKEHRNH